MDIAQILRSQGFKVTPQRIAIYDALRGHHDHPTAEMLYHTLRPEHPSTVSYTHLFGLVIW